jgi:hypothetical protein
MGDWRYWTTASDSTNIDAYHIAVCNAYGCCICHARPSALGDARANLHGGYRTERDTNRRGYRASRPQRHTVAASPRPFRHSGPSAVLRLGKVGRWPGRP